MAHSDGQPAKPERLRSLEPLSELMALDTRPGYPMGFFVECGCEGSLDREKLHRALVEVTIRHPNTRSSLVWKCGRPYWRATDSLPRLFWDPQPEEEDPWRPFDLDRESGLRLIVLSDGTGDHLSWRVIFYGHHAVCDGLSACELFGEIWTHYAGGPPRPLADPTSIVSDAKPVVTEDGEKQKPIAEQILAVVAEGFRFLRFFPARLARGGEQTDRPIPCRGAVSREPPYQLCIFTAEQLDKLRHLAAKRSVTLNDWILASSMRVFASWNADAGASRRGIRITVPVSLRTSDAPLPAENRIGYAFLDRKIKDCRDADALAVSLAAATGWIKESGAAGMFITALKILRRVPYLLWVMLRLPVCFSTAVVSNLGNAAMRMQVELPQNDVGQVAGDIVITHLVGIPPVRPRTAASVGIARYGDRLWISCLADEEQLGAGAAEQILGAIHRECLK